jgi:2-succinyl-5-enolpyruvyl-6-hydroxy-3-cyclohexene-1-carboxylate synthase
VYLGNSLPIREWDLSAVKKAKCLAVTASRGLAGIDGQISTFLGLCQPQRENWGIFGDLTTLYDLAGCWILPQMENIRITLVVVNNGGGKIFYRMFPHNKEMLNSHKLNFEPLANMWGLAYQCWQAVPESFTSNGRTLLEIVPDEEATIRFWSKLEAVKQKAAAFAEA